MEALFSLFCRKSENGTHLALEIKPWTWIRSWFLGKGTLWFALISSLYSENKQNILKALRGHTLLNSLPASFNLPGFLAIQHLLKTCSESSPVVSLCGLGSVERIPGKTSLCESGHSQWKNIFFIDISLDLKPRLNWYSVLSSQSPSLLPTQA